MPKRLVLFLATVYTVLLSAGSLLSIGGVSVLTSNNKDKLLHALAYMGLTFLWYLVFKSNNSRAPILAAAISSAIYGMILEVLQGTLTATRELDVFDIIANCSGVTIVSLILLMNLKSSVKKK